ncbi:hypothetical protein [Vitreimonas sp.]|uniref:RAD55 family ATPase n=1 Tax=Vitreimonas sp. TaxID=3069702 RepID=UPI002EDAC36D
MASFVAALPIAIWRASSQAISNHHAHAFRCLGLGEADYRTERALTFGRELALGGTDDLEDRSATGKSRKVPYFDHDLIEETFQRELQVLETWPPRPGMDRHIWGQISSADVFALKIAPPDPESATERDIEPSLRRTRVSNLVREALRKSRGAVQERRGVRAHWQPATAKPYYTAPSPFYIAQLILTRPDIPSTRAYAFAAMRTLIQERVEKNCNGGKQLELNIETVSDAITTIERRNDVGRELKADPSEPVRLFVAHYLAMKGLLVLRLTEDDEGPIPDQEIQTYFLDPERLFDFQDRAQSGRAPGRAVAFRITPSVAQLPEPSDLLNELSGLPLPFEGGEEVFAGGIRFSEGGDIVAAISGTFGTGKTSFCLGLGAALAPLGCRTLFLTCEESEADVEARLQEAIPSHLRRMSPLFDLGCDIDATPTWFQVNAVRVEGGGDADIGRELLEVVEGALDRAELFAPFRPSASAPPGSMYARPIVVIDGVHQLFREADAARRQVDASLRQLIDACRRRKVVVLLTLGAGEDEVTRLSYLCDLVIEMSRAISENPDARASRAMRLIKARRQSARIGDHSMYLSGAKGFRLKPSGSAWGEIIKDQKWTSVDETQRIPIGTDARNGPYRRSHILVLGHGSTGKAGFGLYLLHRKQVDVTGRPRKDGSAIGMPFRSRVLVVSFLYQEPYFVELVSRISNMRGAPASKGQFLPDDTLQDVLALYPGALTPAELFFKIERAIARASLEGIPYTGILIDGIHNVFLQFPEVEKYSPFWPQLYALLRRRPLTVVTTHTEFELRKVPVSEPLAERRDPASFAFNFEHAARRAAPLMNVLVSSSDFVFEMNPPGGSGDPLDLYPIHAVSALGGTKASQPYYWHREECYIEKEPQPRLF